MASVALTDISKVFPRPGGRSIHALRDISLSIAERECLVLLGPSGSGKTTVLRLIAGLDAPTSGSISIGGVAMDGVPPMDRDVAMVFQHHALYPHKTARENLEFGLRLRKIPRAEIESRVREMAEMLALVPMLDVLPAQLSGGQRQRVALGRALIRRPKVLLCDEPLSQLDAPLRAQLRAELLRLRERLAVTVIYVTHDQVEAMTLGDRIAVIHAGALQQVDPPLTVYREPANLFVAGSVGMPPMNLLQGTLISRLGRLWFQERIAASEGGLSLPVDARYTTQLQSRAGQPIVLGLRAEFIRAGAGSATGPEAPSVETEILLVERTGADVWLHCDTGTHRLAVRAPESQCARAGDRVRLWGDAAHARYFDPVTQLALG